MERENKQEQDGKSSRKNIENWLQRKFLEIIFLNINVDNNGNVAKSNDIITIDPLRMNMKHEPENISTGRIRHMGSNVHQLVETEKDYIWKLYKIMKNMGSIIISSIHYYFKGQWLLTGYNFYFNCISLYSWIQFWYIIFFIFLYSHCKMDIFCCWPTGTKHTTKRKNVETEIERMELSWCQWCRM